MGLNTLTVVKWLNGGDVFNTDDRTTDSGVNVVSKIHLLGAFGH